MTVTEESPESEDSHTDPGHDHDDPATDRAPDDPDPSRTPDNDPITDRVHDTSWSANLETSAHANDRDLVIAHAFEAVRHTAAGNHVNLVTHGDNGHPREYLYDHLAGLPVGYEYVEQCGCGGHVTRVHVR